MKQLKFYFKVSIALMGLTFFVTSIANASTFYSKGNLPANIRTNWSSTTSGSGSSPTATQWGQSTHTFIIQNGDNMTQSAAWTFGNTLQINNGGSLTTSTNAAYTVTLNGALSISGTLTIAGTALKTFNGAITVNNGGNLNIVNSSDAIFMNSNVTVASGGTFTHKVNYVSSNYLQINGNLTFNGTGAYDYSGFAPVLWMNGSGSHTINTGTTSLFYLLIRNGNLSANGTVTADGPIYASWNDPTGTFHTNGQNVIANWGVINAGGTLYIDGGSLTINGASGLLTGNTVGGGTGNVIMSSGTLTTPSINMGLFGSYTATFAQSGGTITTNLLDIGNACTFTETAGSLNVNGNLNINYASSNFNCTTGTSTISIAGNLTNNGVFSSSTGTTTVNVAGNFTNNNTFTASSTSTVNFYGGGNSLLNGSATTNFYNLTLNKSSSTATVTNSSSDKAFNVGHDLTVTMGNLVLQATDNDYTMSNDVTVSANGTLTHGVDWNTTGKKIGIAGNLTVTGIFNPTVRSHVQLNGSGSKTLQTGNNASSTLSILTLINGNFTASGTLKSNQEAWVMFGTTGSFTTNGNNVTFAGLYNNQGTINVNTGGSLTVNGATQIGFGGTTGLMNVSAGTVNLNGDLTIGTSGTVTCTNSPQINITGNWANNGIFTPATSTVTCIGASNQTIDNASSAFNNLIINPSSGITVSPVTNNISILNNLTVSSGIFNLGTLTCNRSTSGGTLSVASGATLKLAGASGGPTGSNFPNNFSTNALNANSAVEYNGSVAQTIYDIPTYGHLTLSTGNIKTAGGNLTVAGDLALNSTATFAGSSFIHSVGGNWYNNVSSTAFDRGTSQLAFNGTVAQTIGGTAGTSFYSVVIANSAGISISASTPADVYNALTYSGTGRSLTTNDNLTLKSTATNTAWIGDVTGNIITGKVTVERYLSARKGWRFLSVPTDNISQTIKEAWQEGAATTGSDPVPGFGTQITSDRASWSADGFDLYSLNGPSMKTYNSATATWDGVTNTGNPIKATTGYMTFIRGDRTANAFSSPASQTVLRTRGDLYTGDQASITVNAGEFTAIGNPFASALDMRYITKTGVKNFFYLWDPQLAGNHGYGAYQTFSYDGSDYVVTPGGGSYAASGMPSNYIQSGQAFFVEGDVGGGSLTFNEAAKTTGSALISAPARLPQSQLRANLLGIDADNSTYIADGLLINYDNSYSNDVDDMDGIKIINASENLSAKTADKLLVVERRHTINSRDTIFLNLTNVKVQQYRFEITADELDRPGLTAFLEDNYLHTTTPLNLNGSTTIDFSIVNIPGSYSSDRFRIVFTPSFVMPLRITSVKAYQKDKNIAVEWKVENESNMKEYNVEKSVDGNHYNTVNTVAAQ